MFVKVENVLLVIALGLFSAELRGASVVPVVVKVFDTTTNIGIVGATVRIVRTPPKDDEIV
jgi:hypothetical protein